MPRQAGHMPFMALLALADVALVPFPFGGSKTSLDSIALGIPTVTLPTMYVRSLVSWPPPLTGSRPMPVSCYCWLG